MIARIEPRLLAIALAAVMLPLTASYAQNPFVIDGVVPDAGTMNFNDPEGNVKELAPENGSTTKIGVINTDPLPTLDRNNPNPQVDLTQVWLDSATATNGDIWLYFAWERDSNNGSGFIALELGQQEAPLACDFSGATSEAELIAGCNPWANRMIGDRLFLWDQQGNSTTISQRTFTGTGFSDPVTIPAADAVAMFSATGSRGEVAVNLSRVVFEPGQCVSIANVLPSTVTGNSDTADFKDTVFFNGFRVSNCGTVIVRKQTDPDGVVGLFDYTHNLDTPDPDPGPFSLSDDGVETIAKVFQGSYWVTESDPSAQGFDLVDIDCSASDVPANTAVDVPGRTVALTVGPDETVDCTFTNRARGSITIVKDAIPDDGQSFAYSGDLDAFSLQDNGDEEDGAPASITRDDLLPGSYGVTETVPSGWDLTALTCSDDSGTNLATATATIALGAGEHVTCTFTNTKRGRIEIVKTDDAGNLLAGVTFSLYADNAPIGGSRGAEDTDTGLDCTTDGSGQCSVDNLIPRAYWVVEDAPPAGYASAPEQAVTVDAGATVSLSLENPRLHKVIVIVCHQGTDTLAASDVSNGGGSLTTLGEGATLPSGITEAALCSLAGFADKPHGPKDLTVDVGSDAH